MRQVFEFLRGARAPGFLFLHHLPNADAAPVKRQINGFSRHTIDVSDGFERDPLVKETFLSHSLVHEAYKELSMNIGTASSLMASLPAVIMGLVGLSELAARTYEKATSASNASTTNASTPTLVDTASVLATRSAGDILTNLQGSAVMRSSGANSPVTNGAFLELGNAVSSARTDAKTRDQTLSSASSWIHDVTQSLSNSKSAQTGLGTDLVKAIRESLTDSTASSTRVGKDKALATYGSNSTQANLGVEANAGISVGSSPGGGGPSGAGLLSRIPGVGALTSLIPSVNAGVKVSGSAAATATNQASATDTITQNKSVDEASLAIAPDENEESGGCANGRCLTWAAELQRCEAGKEGCWTKNVVSEYVSFVDSLFSFGGSK